MKKLTALLLALVLCLGATSALAAGKLEIVNQHLILLNDPWDEDEADIYMLMTVKNAGDKPICVKDGVLEVYDEEGEVLFSKDYMEAYAEQLQPGEYTYVKFYGDMEKAEARKVKDFSVDLTGKRDGYYETQRIPCEVKLELNAKDEFGSDTTLIYCTVTNTGDQPLYELNVVFALFNEEGRVNYLEDEVQYDLGIAPGSTVIVRHEVPSYVMEALAALKSPIASADAIAYTKVMAD